MEMTGSNASLGPKRASGFWAATQAAQQRILQEEEEGRVPGSTHPFSLTHALETIYSERGYTFIHCLLIMYASNKNILQLYFTCIHTYMKSFPGGSDGKESIHLQSRKPGFNPWVGKIPQRKEGLRMLVFFPAEFHGQRSMLGHRPWGSKELDTTKRLTLLTVYSVSLG